MSGDTCACGAAMGAAVLWPHGRSDLHCAGMPADPAWRPANTGCHRVLRTAPESGLVMMPNHAQNWPKHGVRHELPQDIVDASKLGRSTRPDLVRMHMASPRSNFEANHPTKLARESEAALASW